MNNIHALHDAFQAKPCGPRTYRPHRQRMRPRVAPDTKGPAPQSELRIEGRGRNTEMSESTEDKAKADGLIDRASLCLPDFATNSIVHGGGERFKHVLRRYVRSAESNANERLVKLKSNLREASTQNFWEILMEEMCDITGSQCGFVAKRMLVDDQDSAVEMPELGEPGSCLMGVAFYVNNGANVKELHQNYRYHAFGTPCAYMKHDKVFIVPERLAEFVPNNPNPMPWNQSEAFIGLPLFSEGKCFAHFGLIWSSEGASRRNLGWTFLEMFLHSLEDLILQRIVEGRGFAQEAAPPESIPAKVIPLSAITASQSLKPYAQSLSHELRTPMQGVVGMLDIMYLTVIDAISNQQNDRAKEVFSTLKNHIEIVQDSSKRAVEAADNVVNAYDLNMQMPDTSLAPALAESVTSCVPPSALSSRSQSPVPETRITSPVSTKRARSEESNFQNEPAMKRMFTMTEAKIRQKYYPDDGSACDVCGKPSIANFTTALSLSKETPPAGAKITPAVAPAILSPNHRRANIRDFMRTLLNEALRNGHPISETHTETDLGEMIEVRTITARGDIQDRTIALRIERGVPEVVIVEELHLQFALQKVIDNAIKFTDSGSITVTVRMARNLQVVEIRVVDTGCGISEDSKSNLFKPHFQEDASITRARDGLGLSLFNAKANVRQKLGGDITLERSATEGPDKGSEFLIRLPITILDLRHIDVPLIGTPPNGTEPPALPTPALESGLVTNVISFFPTPSDPPPTKISSKSRQKQKSNNRNLANLYPLKILIAEDNAINRNVAIGTLSKLGYTTDYITLAFDGVEAVNHYKESLSKSAEERYDIILMDIWMPNMDGFEATARILDLAKETAQTTKIIAITADITGECLSRAEAVGMHGFLAKPYKVLDIENIIIEHFQTRVN